MTKKARDISKALEQFGKQPDQSFAAIVTAVDGETCTVDNNGYLLYEVRLRATVDGNNNKVVLIPKVDSYVMISRINNDDDYYISMVSEVEDVVMSIAGKFNFKNVSTSLKEVLNDFVKELKMAIITTPAGAGSVSPTTQAKLDLIDAKINNLLT